MKNNSPLKGNGNINFRHHEAVLVTARTQSYSFKKNANARENL